MAPSGPHEEAALGHVPIRSTFGTSHGVETFMVNDGGRIIMENIGNIGTMNVRQMNIAKLNSDAGPPIRYAFQVNVGPWQL